MFTRVAGFMVLVCVAAWAMPDDWEREVREIQMRLEAIRGEAEKLHEQKRFDQARKHAGQFIEVAQHMAHKELLPLAERLDKQGKEDAAHAVRREAERILHEAEKMAAHVREFDRKRQNPEEIVEGLKAGVRALVALGKHEEAEHLERIAAEVERRARHRNKELEVVERRIEVYRLAHHAFREAEKREAAEATERIIHAFELALQGRNDEEARHIRERAPKLGQRVELLLYAGKIWDEFGHEGKAKQCFQLGRELQEQWQRKQRGKEHGLEGAMERIEKLEQRLERIERYLKQITER